MKGLDELKEDLRCLFFAGDLRARYWVYRGWVKLMYHIPPQLLTDRGCFDKPRDSLYVDCAYRYLFGLSDRFPVLADEGEYLAAADDNFLEVERVLFASWSLSLRMRVLLSAKDYDVQVKDTRVGWLNEAKRRPNPASLIWPKVLEQEEFPLLDAGIPFQCINSGFDHEVLCIAVYYSVLS